MFDCLLCAVKEGGFVCVCGCVSGTLETWKKNQLRPGQVEERRRQMSNIKKTPSKQLDIKGVSDGEKGGRRRKREIRIYFSLYLLFSLCRATSYEWRGQKDIMAVCSGECRGIVLIRLCLLFPCQFQIWNFCSFYTTFEQNILLMININNMQNQSILHSHIILYISLIHHSHGEAGASSGWPRVRDGVTPWAGHLSITGLAQRRTGITFHSHSHLWAI